MLVTAGVVVRAGCTSGGAGTRVATAVVISVARAESGAAGAVLGTLATPVGKTQGALSASAIEVAAALDGRPAIVGHIPAGQFPRDMTAAANGTVLVSNFSSGEVEAVDTAVIP